MDFLGTCRFGVGRLRLPIRCDRFAAQYKAGRTIHCPCPFKSRSIAFPVIPFAKVIHPGRARRHEYPTTREGGQDQRGFTLAKKSQFASVRVDRNPVVINALEAIADFAGFQSSQQTPNDARSPDSTYPDNSI